RKPHGGRGSTSAGQNPAKRVVPQEPENLRLAPAGLDPASLLKYSSLGFGYISWPDRKCLFANEALSRMVGVPVDRMMGGRPEEILGSDLPAKTRAILLDAIARGASTQDIEIESEILGRPGETVVFLIDFSLVRDTTNNVQGTWFVVQDVTARRRAERELL